METSLVSFVGGGIREVSVWRKREQVMARVCKAILVQPYHTIPPSWYSHTISYYHPGTTIPYHTTILVQPYYTIPYYHSVKTIPYHTTILFQPAGNNIIQYWCFQYFQLICCQHHQKVCTKGALTKKKVCMQGHPGLTRGQQHAAAGRQDTSLDILPAHCYSIQKYSRLAPIACTSAHFQ